MIRGHRRKGFSDPPIPMNVIAPTETIVINPNIMPTPSTTLEIRNKRSFDSLGCHDPRNALQPAKIRIRKTNIAPKNDCLQTLTPNALESSSSMNLPLPTVQHSSSVTTHLRSQQHHNQMTFDVQNPSETKKRCRRIKITPRRDSLANLTHKQIGWPNFFQHKPATVHPYFLNRRVAVLSALQANLSTFSLFCKLQ